MKCIGFGVIGDNKVFGIIELTCYKFGTTSEQERDLKNNGVSPCVYFADKILQYIDKILHRCKEFTNQNTQFFMSLWYDLKVRRGIQN